MTETNLSVLEQIATVAGRLHVQRTGHQSGAVTVVLTDDTLVVTFRDALSPAETALAKSPAGAAQVRDFHRQLFDVSSGEMRDEVFRITGRRVREAVAEIEIPSGIVIQTLTSGTMVQVFSLDPSEEAPH